MTLQEAKAKLVLEWAKQKTVVERPTNGEARSMAWFEARARADALRQALCVLEEVTHG